VAPAQTNATLVLATRGGRSEEPGASIEPGPGQDLFVGAARCYYQEKRERVPTNTGLDVFVRRLLIVDTRDPFVDWLAGDILSFTRDRAPAQVLVATIETVTATELAEMAGTGVETTRLELRPRK
jgi:hypothetical protein